MPTSLFYLCLIAGLLMGGLCPLLAQPCPKYTQAMQAGEQYLARRDYDRALVEFQAAQIAARECELPLHFGTKANVQVQAVFAGLRRQRDDAEAARREAEAQRRAAQQARQQAQAEAQRNARLARANHNALQRMMSTVCWFGTWPQAEYCIACAATNGE